VKDGKPTTTLHEIRQAVKPLKRLYGKTQARDFGPLALKTIRGQMVELGWLRETVNKRGDSVRRVFKWGVGKELVSPSVLHGLQAVPGLQRGRTDAPDSKGVLPPSPRPSSRPRCPISPRSPPI